MNVRPVQPIVLNKEIAYIVGVIIGDGHISKSNKSKTDLSKDYKISIELADKDFAKEVANIIKNRIKTKSNLIKRPNREHYYFQFRNKSFYYFMTKDMGVPPGKKSDIVKVPKTILRKKDLQFSFLAGLFDTDGGVRGNSVGFTSASEKLIHNVSEILDNFRIKYYKDSWINKKYQQKYYGLRINKRFTDKFLNNLPIMNLKKRNKVFYHVGVPERSNGLDNSLIKNKN